MIGNIAAELFVLRKRASTWILLGIWIALGAIFAYAFPYITYRNNDGSPLVDVLPQDLVGNLLVGFPFFGGAIALMLGVLSFGSEYGWGTLKTLFTQRPGRLRIFGAKLMALGITLTPFVILVFAIGVIFSYTIAQVEGAAVDWPSVWLIIRALAAGWFILAVWAMFGVMLAILSRGTALAIGVGIIYALALEGLLSALTGQVSLLEPLVELFLRSSAYSLVVELGTPRDAMADRGPGSFSGPFVDGSQALLVMGVYIIAFTLVSGFALRQRDVTG